MDKKPCPICTRLNELQETHCWFCHAELLPVSNDQPPSSDWLNGLRQDQDASSGNVTELPAKSSEHNVTGMPEDYVPDWLSRIRTREASERAEKKAEEDKYWAKKQSNSGVPDWLHSLNEDSAEKKINAEESAPLDLENPTIESPIEGHQIISSGSEDWLESLKSWQPVDESENLINPENPETNESPAEVVITPQPDSKESFEILPEPDFDLEKIFSPVSEEFINATEEPRATSEVILPEGLQPFEITFDETEIQSTNVQLEQVVPDILSTIDSRPQEEPEFESVSALPHDSVANQKAEEDLVIALKPILDDSTTQALDSAEHLSPVEQIKATQPQPDIQVEHEENIAGISADDVSAEKPIDPFISNDIHLEPFAPDDLPEWLTDVKPNEKKLQNVKPLSESKPVDDGSPRPEKGNLPVWLAAQRPVEAVEMAALPEERNPETVPSDGGQAETVMSGISTATFVGKPSDLGGGLKISNRQKTNAALLSVIAANTELPEDDEKSSLVGIKNTLWRLILAIVFIVVALLGRTVLNGYGIQPALFPGEVVHSFDHINSIPADKTVLLAGDFEAGFAGEIRLTSQSLIEHIMRRNLNIALMSINPVDSALLVDQIGRGLASVPTYQADSKVVDLGYFPGGAIAVQDLGNSFSIAVPLTAERVDTSTQELLKSIQNMSDFGAIIVITDKAETARVWIEQLQPTLEGTPLLMVTSAQVSPLIQPYYQSGQVGGIVSGMSAGLIYERILGANGEASRNHTSLQLLSVLMAALILGGGFVSLVRPGFTGGNRQ